MWVARDKDGKLKMFSDKPIRDYSWKDCYCVEKKEFWTRDTSKYPPIHYACADALYNPNYQITYLDDSLFPDLKWEDEPIEVDLIEKRNFNDSLVDEFYDDTITLTYYYEDYDKEHEWFINMLKQQEMYKNRTDEQLEEIWGEHIKQEYTSDEILDTIQCDGYTKIALRMGRHDIQPDYDYVVEVVETKEYIDEKLKKICG